MEITFFDGGHIYFGGQHEDPLMEADVTADLLNVSITFGVIVAMIK